MKFGKTLSQLNFSKWGELTSIFGTFVLKEKRIDSNKYLAIVRKFEWLNVMKTDIRKIYQYKSRAEQIRCVNYRKTQLISDVMSALFPEWIELYTKTLSIGKV